MSNPSLQDGSAGDPNASSQSQILLHIKKLLAEAQACLYALDQSTLAGLRSDEEYKGAIENLLSPLTPIPLSNVVNKALTSGVDAAASQLRSLLLSLEIGAAQDGKDVMDSTTTASPSSLATAKSEETTQYCKPPTPDHCTSASSTRPQRDRHASRPAPQPPVVSEQKQITKELSFLLKIQQNRRMMATIYFIEGGKKDSLTMPRLVEEMNKTWPIIAAGGVSYAWETVRGDIVIALCVPQTYATWKASNAILARFSELWAEGSLAYLRFGGDRPIYVLELEVVRGIHWRYFDWDTSEKAIEQEFREMYGKSSSTWNSFSLSFLAGTALSKRWMLCEGYGSNIQLLVAEKWPRIYKQTSPIEISMTLFCITDSFDFRS